MTAPVTEKHRAVAETAIALMANPPRYNERVRCPGCKAINRDCDCNGWAIGTGRERDAAEHRVDAVAAAIAAAEQRGFVQGIKQALATLSRDPPRACNNILALLPPDEVVK